MNGRRLRLAIGSLDNGRFSLAVASHGIDEALARKPFREGPILAKNEDEALIDDVIAAGIEIPAVVFEILQDIPVELDGDLVALLFRLLGNDGCHGVCSVGSVSVVRGEC